jgi:hypothetical protein
MYHNAPPIPFDLLEKALPGAHSGTQSAQKKQRANPGHKTGAWHRQSPKIMSKSGLSIKKSEKIRKLSQACWLTKDG